MRRLSLLEDQLAPPIPTGDRAFGEDSQLLGREFVEQARSTEELYRAFGSHLFR